MGKFIFEEIVHPIPTGEIQKQFGPSIIESAMLRFWETYSHLGSHGRNVGTPRFKGIAASLEERVSHAVKQTDMRYEYTADFFRRIASTNYCTVDYSPELGFPIVSISHVGKETFLLGGQTRLYTAQDFTFGNGRTPFFTVPVIKGDDRFNLLLLDYSPSIHIPSVGELTVSYEFETFFSLYRSRERPAHQTLTPYLIESLDEGLFGQGSQLLTLLLGMRPFESQLFSTLYYDRTFFKMKGEIFSGSTHLYNGRLDSQGTFPFFIQHDGGKSRVEPIPSVQLGNSKILVK